MEFNTLKQHAINTNLFEFKQNTIKKAECEEYYTESSLQQLKQDCEKILAKGKDASQEEVDSLEKALQEIQSLQKGLVEVDGDLVPAYFRK